MTARPEERTDVDVSGARAMLLDAINVIDGIVNVTVPRDNTRQGVLADMRRRIQYAAHLADRARVEIEAEYYDFKLVDDKIGEQL